jgi:ABC-type transport system involved in multi-copper enzyme maturation permease subunit
MKFTDIVWTEFAKLRRCAIVWITFIAYALMVAVAGLFMWMLANPEAAKGLGLLSQKANLAVGGQAADWPSFLGFVLEMSGLGGLIFLSMIMAFVFGREYAEGTAKNMLALPAPRAAFVAAKLFVAATWFAALTACAILMSLAMGAWIGLPGFSRALFLGAARKIVVASLMDFCLGPLIAWIAVRSRGYFAPLGASIATLLLATAVGATEWGRWCPWSIVLWYTGAGGQGRDVGPGSYAVLAAFLALGVFFAVFREARADNAQ